MQRVLGWIAFWSMAAAVAAVAAYLVTVPGAVEGPVALFEADENSAEMAEEAQPEPVPESVPEPAPQPLHVSRPDPEPQHTAPGDFVTGVQPASQPETEPERQPESRPAPQVEQVLVPQTPILPRVPAQPASPAPPATADLGALVLADLPISAQCGLILRPLGEREIIFASGVSLDPEAGGPAAIELDGELVLLRRFGVDGEPLGYNQFPRQLFRDEGDRVTVVIDIALEEELGADSARVSGGTLTVMKAQRSTTRMEVGGRAGC